jgi:hypothetical protein
MGLEPTTTGITILTTFQNLRGFQRNSFKYTVFYPVPVYAVCGGVFKRNPNQIWPSLIDPWQKEDDLLFPLI